MSRETLGLPDAVAAYMRQVGMRDDPDLAALRAETAKLSNAQMQIAAEQGQFMALLVKMLGARKTVEVGVFTGYSAMVVAKAMGPEGRVVALDVSEEYTSVARQHWAKAGVAGRIDLRLAPAADSLKALVAGGESGTFDFAFIDADKENYATYYDLCLTLLRKGGLIAIDNVFWSGRVADPADQSEATKAIREINKKVHADPSVEVSMVSIGDGLTLALKL